MSSPQRVFSGGKPRSSISLHGGSGFLPREKTMAYSPAVPQDAGAPGSPSAATPTCVSGLYIPLYGPSILTSVLVALREASEEGPYEDFAAQKIQATYRMHVQRTYFQAIIRSVCDIQRVYRGHRQRRTVAQMRAAETQRYHLAMFHYYARRIQACFRGYYSRTRIDNFYARKAYIEAVTRKAEAVRVMAEDFNAEEDLLRSLKERERQKNDYMQSTAKVHYMVSTASVSGVYRKPDCTSGTITDFSTNVEEDIRTNATVSRRDILLERVNGNVKGQSKPIKVAGTRSGKAGPSMAIPATSDSSCTSSRGTAKGKEAAHGGTLLSSSTGFVKDHQDSAGMTDAAATYTEGMDAARRKSEKKASSVVMKGEPGAPVVLPPIHPSKQDLTQAKYVYTLSPSTKATCAWESEHALPPQRPLIDPSNATVKRSGGRRGRHDAARQADDDPSKAAYAFDLAASADNAVWKANAQSSFSRKFNVRGHDCVEVGGDSIYSTDAASMKRRVDAKLIETMHSGVPFRVSSYALKQ